MMKNMDNMCGSMEKLSDLTTTFIKVQQGFAEEALRLLGDSFGSMMKGTFQQMGMQKTASCCDIPEPCWMPKSLGEYECRLSPGTNGTLRLTVTNEDIQPRRITAVASGAGAGQVTFSPNQLQLGAKERGTITAVFNLGAQTKPCETVEALVWLRGCRDYYARWTITAVDCSKPCCHAISVSDGPDHVLHWYDHFYCPRPCMGRGQQG